MRVGFLQVYDEVNWIKHSLKMAMKYCDKLVIIEGSQFANFKDIPVQSTDGTLEIIKEWVAEYPKEIELLTTIRKSQNYRENQAANFNLALKRCKIGDYFLPFDADDFYFDEYIKNIIEITDDGKIDFLKASGPNFAFSFNWQFIQNEIVYYLPQVLFKKTKKLKFRPTHKPINHGENIVLDESGKWLNHYKWVKPTSRMLLRHKTSGFFNGMLKWFNKNWNTIELRDNNRVNYYGGYFILKKYDGPHPRVLSDHPWRNIEDVRQL